MAANEKLVERIRRLMSDIPGATERKMFGGHCFSINGHMACGVQKDDLMVRVGPDRQDDALRQKHARPMDFTGRPMKGYVFVAAGGTVRTSDLAEWIHKAAAFVNTLPSKTSRKRTTARR